MTDRELLELAAKAAGMIMSYYEYDDSHGFVKHVVHGVPHCGLDYSDYWNPLADDGQALRLAVKLNLLYGKAFAQNVNEQHKDDIDIFAAARRAIVRAAAEIGKNG